MKRLFAVLFILNVLFISTSHADEQEAQLSATVLPGALEIDPRSLDRVFTPVNGVTFKTTSERQKDAIHFIIDDITINDLNGDGMGWTLRAFPTALRKEGSRLPIGTLDGFFNPSEPQYTNIARKAFVQYTGADQTSGYTIDFGIHYNIPAFAETGTYTGEVALVIKAD